MVSGVNPNRLQGPGSAVGVTLDAGSAAAAGAQAGPSGRAATLPGAPVGGPPPGRMAPTA